MIHKVVHIFLVQIMQQQPGFGRKEILHEEHLNGNFFRIGFSRVPVRQFPQRSPRLRRQHSRDGSR